ncbi:MAG: heme-binding domain-containing protein [Chitinophagaceae bacterium]|nr:heme-binding domain-containing protein [Chitinophagaceae bacterium]
MVKKILWVLLAVFVVIQFIHPRKNSSSGIQPAFIGKAFPVPDTVHSLLKESCMDCHSNNTRYPWYSRIQPVHWWLNHHIVEGKEHLNFDEFTSLPMRYQYHKMEEIIEVVKEEEMPLSSYLWMHKKARLSTEQRIQLTKWAQSVMDTMKARYPADSLHKTN